MKSTPKFKAIPYYSEKRLPTPCPLPTFTPIVQQGIENNKIKGNLMTRMLRDLLTIIMDYVLVLLLKNIKGWLYHYVTSVHN